MRIALATLNARLVGGVESYLDLVVPLLKEEGHDTALICEVDAPTERRRISLGSDTPLWCVVELGLKRALAELTHWRPDVIYSHNLSDPKLDRQLIAIAPAVRFVHSYHGTCISGGKTFKYPVPRSCARPFEALCLAHFYPHRCGGLNPVTMWRDYRQQAERLQVLRDYRMLVVASEHMRNEYLRQGFPTTGVRPIGLPIVNSKMECAPSVRGFFDTRNEEYVEGTKPPSRVVFIGRMEYLKGGLMLIDAMRLAVIALDRPLTLTFAGEGRDRTLWEEKARRSCCGEERLDITFTGWLEREALNALLDSSDLLAVPSLWPEPFGLIGPEAGTHGVPAAGFKVGGIPEWLKDGVNGYLARSDPPTATALSVAIANCLRNQAEHTRLRCGACEQASRFGVTRHLKQLTEVLREVAEL
jgi:glycosyltransferase involved in cell wall biosynthesis